MKNNESYFLSKPCTAFMGMVKVFSGQLIDVALAIKGQKSQTSMDTVLTFDDTNGSVIDLDLRGTTADIVSRLTKWAKHNAPNEKDGDKTAVIQSKPGRGRPRLGVVAREVTLLPRHWEWLARQRGGASNALRRLVDEARRNDNGLSDRRAAQEACYRFIAAIGGNLPGFEEVARALFAHDKNSFLQKIAEWPQDIQEYSLKLISTTNDQPIEQGS